MNEELKAQFLNLYCMALADGVVEMKELEMLYQIGTEQFDLTSSEITEVVRDTGSSFALPSDLKEKIRFLYNMALIANADGTIDESERNLLRKYIEKMNFENVDGIENYLISAVKEGKTVENVINETV